MRRRQFLEIGAGAAALGATAKATAAPPRLREVADAALAAAKALGASYCDVRIVRRRSEHVSTRDDHVQSADASDSFGVGVRVLAKGTWGFAATQDVTPVGSRAAAQTAVAIARANSRLRKEPVTLAPAVAARDAWQTPLTKDPFRIPLANKIALLLELNRAARANPSIAVAAVNGSIHSLAEDKLFFSSEGSEIDQTIVRLNPFFNVTVAQKGDFESRMHQIQPISGGWEHVEKNLKPDDATAVAREAWEKLKADAVTPGEKDLVLLPSHLWLTIHESLGHSTELDRALGYEANFAGTSFATPDQTHRLRYGGDNMNVYADRTTAGALATVGYDDDGAKAHRWDLIKKGVLVDWQTTREQAAWIGASGGHACAYAESWAHVPFQRMPNVSLAASDSPVTLDQLIAGVVDGVLVDGRGSYSIDQQRLNFQFGGDFCREIKNGKLGKPLRHVAYQSTTPQFWSAMDALGGAATWEVGGSFYDGKGEPGQSNPVSHGTPPARFRKIRVLDARGQS